MSEKKGNGLRKRLLSTFRIEVVEHLKTISSGLIELEKSPAVNIQMEIVETIYRLTHSIKGAARTVNMTDIVTICQTLEGIFSAWKEEERVRLYPEIFSVFHRTIDLINRIISSEEGQAVVEKNQILKIIEELSAIEASMEESVIQKSSAGREDEVQEPAGEITATYTKPLPPLSETVRISTARLKSILLEVEEMLPAKVAAGQHVAGLRDIGAIFDSMKNECKKKCLDIPGVLQTIKRKEIRGEAEKLLSEGMQEFLSWMNTQIKLIRDRLAVLTKSNAQFSKFLTGTVDNLLYDMKNAMMLPFFTILEAFPLFVRNISHEVGKEVEVVLKGEWLEIDRRILEEIKNPLIHLVRNSIDHGIEKPEIRLKNGKKRQGTITIAISQISGNKIEILISDDGGGIDIESVKKTAVKNEILSQTEADNLDEHEAISLIFDSGVSISPVITDISGRGLGLAIVREKVEKLNGIISVETKPNAGTKFRIFLPLTVATFRGILVKASEQIFIIPSPNVERCVRIKRDEIKTVENRETITLNDIPLSFVWLHSVIGIPLIKKKGNNSLFAIAIILGINGNRIAFGVDEIIGEQEVMAKGLGKQLKAVRNIGGATFAESGRPVPILNVPDLMRSAVKTMASPKIYAPEIEEVEGERKSILVVEDSVTSRILLKDILESAGYDVRTAVDGIDAITALRSEDFDLVVSDIEMPRMDGFDLTLKIRGDKKLSELPVILVTALEKREDRERGIDVGANAYIAKSSFDQSNLLEVVRRLI